MWGWNTIRRVARKIGKTVRNYAPGKDKRSAPDQVQQLRQVFWACAGELSREIAWRYAPGCIGSTLLYKSLKGAQRPRIQSAGFSSGELKASSSELKDKRERMSRLEQEISSLKEERREWQMERLMLMASILALAAGANLKPPRN